MNEPIRNRQDFLLFLEKFSAEAAKGSFANTSLPEFLAAMEGWIEDMDGYYTNMNQPFCDGETLTWRTLADILCAAAVYE